MAVLSAVAAFRLRRSRPRRGCYRGSMLGTEAVVTRPDGSGLDPIPIERVEAMATFRCKYRRCRSASVHETRGVNAHFLPETVRRRLIRPSPTTA